MYRDAAVTRHSLLAEERGRATLSAVIVRLDRTTQYSEASVIEARRKSRHCEERKRRSNPLFLAALWIASRSLSSGAHSRDPLARNDVDSSEMESRIRGVLGPRFRGDDGLLWRGAVHHTPGHHRD
jgi:hypothetical protein